MRQRRTKAKRFLGAVVSVLAVTGIVAPAARAAEPAQPDVPLSLQAQINAAPSGATINVPPGDYVGGLNFGGKNITLHSTGGAGVTTIDGNGGVGVQIGPGGTLDGFTVTNSYGTFGAGLVANGQGSLITHNVFVGNVQGAGGFGAAIAGNTASPTVTDNRFSGNTCDTQGLSGVVAFVNSSAPHISNNLFSDNSCRAINLTLPEGNAPVVANNTFVGNSVAIRVDGRVPSATEVFRNNLLYDNTVGLEVDYGSNGTWDHNLVWQNDTDYQGTADPTGTSGNLRADPALHHPPDDLHLGHGSAAIDAGTTTNSPGDDFDGTLRPLDGDLDGTATPDIGAYEAHSEARFHPITPVRVADTRLGQGGTRLGPGQTITLTVPGGSTGIPSTGASAVAVNLTAVAPSDWSYLTAWPAGRPRPTTSNVNVVPGRTIANAAQIALGASGGISVFNSSGTVDLVVDVVGWYDTGSDDTGSRYTGVQPNRILDTRFGQGGSTLDAGGTLVLHVDGTDGVPHSGVTAVAVNLAAVNQTASTYLTAWPGGARPLASTLDAPPGSPVPNLAIVPVSPTGDIELYNDLGQTDVIVDVVGWWSDLPGLTDGTYATAGPSRVLDTRIGIGTSVHRLGPGDSIEVPFPVSSGVSKVGLGAVAVNITAVDPSMSSYLTAYPTGSPRPTASNLNLDPHRDVAGFAIVAAGPNGTITIFNASGTVDVVVDVVGWYTAPVAS